jgi:hypothetical protein
MNDPQETTTVALRHGKTHIRQPDSFKDISDQKI